MGVQASESPTKLLQVSVAAGQVWWLYGPPSVGKSATARALFTQVLNGEPHGYCDIDQVGLKRRLGTRYGPNDTARAFAESDRSHGYDSTGLLVDTGEGDPLATARRVAAAVRSAASPGPAPSTRPRSAARAPAGTGPERAGDCRCGAAAAASTPDPT